ncbi:MAG: hypothetical protein HRF42_11015 [Candidatus Brocadia sp.]
MRDMVFREAVLAFLGVKDDNGEKPAQEKCTAGRKKLCQFEYAEYLEWACQNCRDSPTSGNAPEV